MSLYPYNDQDRIKDIKEKRDFFYRQAISINQFHWMEADIDLRFFSGDQTLWSSYYSGLTARQRKLFFFNRIRPIINMVSGFQRRNRKSTIVTPVENADEQTADQFSKILIWMNQQDNVLETISEAFEGAIITGMNLLQLWMDYRHDPISGNLKVTNCPYNSFLIDPFFRNADLSDCNGIWKRSFISKREVMSLLPENSKQIENVDTIEATRDKFYYMPENFYFPENTLLTYDEYYYRDFRKQKMLYDTNTGETLEWKNSNEAALKSYLSQYPEVILETTEIPTVRLAIFVQDQLIYDGPNPLGIDSYPFVPVMAYYNPQMVDYACRIQGIVRGLRDVQYIYNRRKAIELDILESQVNSGFIYKEDAPLDPNDMFLTGQGKGIALKRTAQMTDVQQIQSPQIPPTTLEVSRIMGEEFFKVSGANEELMGSATDEKAGILAMMRQGAGLTTLQPLFDSLDRSQKILGRLQIEVIQANFVPAKIKRIINEEPSPQFYNRNFGFYDAAVEEGLNTSTQKQMQFAQYLQLKEVGVAIPDSALIKACTIQDKKSLLEEIEAINQQQQQMAQAQQEAQTQEIQARTQLAMARAQADQGLGLERVSRIQENHELAGERKAQANRDDQAALLDTIKALKEIDTMDIDHIERLINMLNAVKSDVEEKKETKEQNGSSKKG